VVKGVVWRAFDVRIECSCCQYSSADAIVVVFVASEATRNAQPQQQQPTHQRHRLLVGVRKCEVRSFVRRWPTIKYDTIPPSWVVAIVDRREARHSLLCGASCRLGWSSREKAENACHPSVCLSVVSTINTFITKRKDLSSVCPAACGPRTMLLTDHC
jgi:hypothetical protein